MKTPLAEHLDGSYPCKSDTVWIIGDAHFGHRNIGVYREGVDNDDANRQFIGDFWREWVHPKRSDVWMLGDMAFTHEARAFLRALPGRVQHWVLGNHDVDPMTVFDLDSGRLRVHGMVKKFGTWFSHAPIHPDELRGCVNVHGHVHNATIDDDRYFNCSVDNLLKVWGQPMITLAQLRGWMEHRNY